MCGVWVAMEDIHPDSGPLVVYPGSHRLPDYDMADLGVPPQPGNYYCYEEFVRDALAALGILPMPLLMKQGQCALWLANLYHGGTGIRDARPAIELVHSINHAEPEMSLGDAHPQVHAVTLERIPFARKRVAKVA